ncbi:hypothetical protein D3C71_2145730 [compost metagenome]
MMITAAWWKPALQLSVWANLPGPFSNLKKAAFNSGCSTAPLIWPIATGSKLYLEHLRQLPLPGLPRSTLKC